MLDSLRLAAADPGRGTDRAAIDLGSGAGLPGLVLAIATGMPFDLVEADRRKAAFLTEAQRRDRRRRCGVHAARIEAAALAPGAAGDRARAGAAAGVARAGGAAAGAGRDAACFPRARGRAASSQAAREAVAVRAERPGAGRTRRSCASRSLARVLGRIHRGRQPEGRRRQDHDGDQSRHRPGGDRRAGAADRPGSAGQRLHRPRASSARGAWPRHLRRADWAMPPRRRLPCRPRIPGLRLVPAEPDLAGRRDRAGRAGAAGSSGCATRCRHRRAGGLTTC